MDLSSTIKEVIAYVSADARDYGIVGVVNASEVTGKRQSSDCRLFDHEFVDQRAMYDDDFYGDLYLPIGNDEYLQVKYWT